MSLLSSLMVKMAEDPDFARQFNESPEDLLQDAGLSEDDKSQLQALYSLASTMSETKVLGRGDFYIGCDEGHCVHRISTSRIEIDETNYDIVMENRIRVVLEGDMPKPKRISLHARNSKDPAFRDHRIYLDHIEDKNKSLVGRLVSLVIDIIDEVPAETA